MDRILKIKDIQQAKDELKKINVSSQEIAAISSKMLFDIILLKNINIEAANILKQEMLLLGADAAISQKIVEGEIEQSDVILIADHSKYRKLLEKLKSYRNFSFPDICQRINKLLKISKNNEFHLKLADKDLKIKPTLVMGILNVTPDSFSDGGCFLKKENAIAKIENMIEEGADIIDIGGESSRPGAIRINVQEELKRVIPVIESIRKKYDIPLSIDTSKAEVADKAIESGANIINDISALKFDQNMLKVCHKHENIYLILMHMQGIPQTMQKTPYYQDVISEIGDFFEAKIDFCIFNGIKKERLIIDPGIGFGKRFEDNLLILQKIAEFHSLGVPLLLGASRKRFINEIYPSESIDRLAGSLATTALAFENNVQIVRVHDVKAHKQLIQTLEKIRNTR